MNLKYSQAARMEKRPRALKDLANLLDVAAGIVESAKINAEIEDQPDENLELIMLESTIRDAAERYRKQAAMGELL